VFDDKYFIILVLLHISTHVLHGPQPPSVFFYETKSSQYVNHTDMHDQC